jgi:hypothetical protein
VTKIAVGPSGPVLAGAPKYLRGDQLQRREAACHEVLEVATRARIRHATPPLEVVIDHSLTSPVEGLHADVLPCISRLTPPTSHRFAGRGAILIRDHGRGLSVQVASHLTRPLLAEGLHPKSQLGSCRV